MRSSYSTSEDAQSYSHKRGYTWSKILLFIALVLLSCWMNMLAGWEMCISVFAMSSSTSILAIYLFIHRDGVEVEKSFVHVNFQACMMILCWLE